MKSRASAPVRSIEEKIKFHSGAVYRRLRSNPPAGFAGLIAAILPSAAAAAASAFFAGLGQINREVAAV